MSDILSVDESSFHTEVIQSDKPVLVDFWAEWCNPCKMIAPVLEEISKTYADKLKIAKLNVDNSPDIATKFGVRSIPTLLLFKQGQVAATKIGALSKSQLAAFIDSNI